MTERAASLHSNEDLRALQRMTKIGFDTSSLNQIGVDPDLDAVCAGLVSGDCAPLLSAVTIVEVLKWGDEARRDQLLDIVARLRRVADYRLLPLPHEIVEGEFLAWLTNQPAAVYGGEPMAEGMQDLLERAEARRDGWAAVATTFADAEQRSLTERVASVRTRTQQLAAPSKPQSAAEFLSGLMRTEQALADVLNAWFTPTSRGHAPLTPEAASTCLRQLPVLRAYFVSLGLAAYRHGVQGKSLRKPAAGAIDISQAAMLPLMDAFFVDDGGMNSHMLEVVRHCALPTVVVRYADVRARIVSTDWPPRGGGPVTFRSSTVASFHGEEGPSR